MLTSPSPSPFEGQDITQQPYYPIDDGIDDEWRVEEEPFEDPEVIADRLANLPKLPSILPSQFTAFAFRMPRADNMGYENFSFDGRRHMVRLYDSPAKRILLCTARQVEKSTLLGNRMLCYSTLLTAYRSLYVSPSATQTKKFSNDRVKEPIETSPVLKAYTTTMLSKNIFEKQFVNRSMVTLRYAFLNADRTRGIPAHALFIDEFQDVLPDNIPVIEQCLSHAAEEMKRYVYAGTPKSLDNNIEYYRSELSTQGEWVVPCEAHGGETGRYWNILGEKNIGIKGLSCEKCGKLIDPAHPDAQWAFQVGWHPKYAPFESYRIPQLMVPWKDWDEILLDYRRYPRDRFYNEVLGISFDSGLRPLTKAQVMANCTEKYSMADMDEYVHLSSVQPIYAGIDWGTGENSYTVLTIATYIDGKFRVLYMHRFEGEDVDPEPQLRKICEIIHKFKCRVIGVDYGGGFHPNDRLIREFGPQRVQKYQYAGRPHKKIYWDDKIRRWICHRTEVMSDIFNAIRRGGVFEFPRWQEFKDPHASDMLNIYSEYNDVIRMMVYNHRQDRPDDSFHSLLYCFLASMLVQPRPDVVVPRREVDGIPDAMYSGPVWQG